jgi:hypothetical protein
MTTYRANVPGCSDLSNSPYLASLVSIAVTPANPTITYGSNQQFNATGTYSDASTADLTSSVTWAAASPGVATMSAGGLAHAVSQGTSTISASLGAASGSALLTVNKAPQSLAFSPLVNETYGDADFTLSTSASSGLLVSFAASGNCSVTATTVHLTGAGSCTITASQTGNANYTAAPTLSRAFSIAKAAQTIAFGQLAGKTYGDPDFTLSASASSGLLVSFAASGSCTVTTSTVHLTGAGSCTLSASQAGNENYIAAPTVSLTFPIAPKTQLKPPETCKVPNVVGKRLRAAKLAIKHSHCRTGRVGHAYSRKRSKSTVISQSRRPGKTVPANSTINLVVSEGRKR